MGGILPARGHFIEADLPELTTADEEIYGCPREPAVKAKAMEIFWAMLVPWAGAIVGNEPKQIDVFNKVACILLNYGEGSMLNVASKYKQFLQALFL